MYTRSKMSIISKIGKLCFSKHKKFYWLLIRYRNYQRYSTINVSLEGIEFHIPDMASFLEMWQEIIIKEIYRFKAMTSKQVILDFGANIGVSVYYFTKNYPNAEIYAYEADPAIYKILEENVARFDNGHIHLFNQAVYNKNTKIKFSQEGADGGRIDQTNELCTEVEAVDALEILREHKHVDMLKIDIEGSERYVIPAIKENLNIVDNIFLEYHSEVDKKQCLSEIIAALKDFRLFFHPGSSPSRPLYDMQQLGEYDQQMDIFGRKQGTFGINK